MRGLDAARAERGASAAEGRDGGGGSPGLAGREQSERPKAGDTPIAGKALAPKRRGARQGSRRLRPNTGGLTAERAGRCTARHQATNGDTARRTSRPAIINRQVRGGFAVSAPAW